MNDFYVYLHRRKTDGSIFYVGKGCGPRAWSTDGRNRNWVREAVKHGLSVTIFMAGLTEHDAFKYERLTIRMELALGNRLTNIQPGTVKRASQPVRLFKNARCCDMHMNGVPAWNWKRSARTSEWYMATVDTMIKEFGGKRAQWQNVIDGVHPVGPKGWRLIIRRK